MNDTASPDPAELQRSFDHDKVVFEQDCQEFRSLNGLLWQIPVLVSTLTGGLWFGVTKVDSDEFIKSSLFLLAAMVNVVFIFVLWRLRRGVMEGLLDSIHAYQGRPRRAGRYTMISMFTVLLALSTLISLVAFKPGAGIFFRRVITLFCP